MTSSKKKGGLGAESYFENVPTLDSVEAKQMPTETDGSGKAAEEAPVISGEQKGEAVLTPAEEISSSQAPVEEPTAEMIEEPAEEDESGSLKTPDSEEPEPPPRQKIRRTYALYEETQIALEEMKLAARKQGEKMTLGDLLEEAVQLLMEEKGMTHPEKISH